MYRLYRYLGSTRPSTDAGVLVATAADLAEAALSLGARLRFVVDALGTLRVVGPSTAHAAATGGAVRAAGTLAIEGGRITAISNDAPDFCPEPASLFALGEALRAADVAGPPSWTTALEYRRCPTCGGVAGYVGAPTALACAADATPLPSVWNVDRAIAHRRVFAIDGARYELDLVQVAGTSDQDRVLVRLHQGGVLVAIADGSGASGRGREAAEHLVADIEAHPRTDPLALSERLLAVDHALFVGQGGQCTALVFHVGPAGIVGTSVGDTELWYRSDAAWHEATRRALRKPLIGSNDALCTELAAEVPRALFAATDGLFKYARTADVLATLDSVGDDPFRMVEPLWLADGTVPDDATIVAMRRTDR